MARTRGRSSHNHVKSHKSVCCWLASLLLTFEGILTTLFSSNFIGIVFARSLHYQFYSWYFHTLPVLLWRTDLLNFSRYIGFISSCSHCRRILMLALIELSWNVYPATWWSSLILFGTHSFLLMAMWISSDLDDDITEQAPPEEPVDHGD